jgi:hypothetical protein
MFPTMAVMMPINEDHLCSLSLGLSPLSPPGESLKIEFGHGSEVSEGPGSSTMARGIVGRRLVGRRRRSRRSAEKEGGVGVIEFGRGIRLNVGAGGVR